MPDTTFLVALAGAVLGALSLVLHVVAPRTKTTLDDTLRDDIDEVLAFIRGQQLIKATTPAAKLVPPAAAVLLLVVLASMATSCGAGQVATDTGQRVVDCAKQDAAQITAVGAKLAESVTAYLVAGTPVDWDAIEVQAEAVGLAIGGCALGPLVAARGPRSSSTVPARAAATPPANDAARAWAAFARLKAHAGVATFQTSAGPL